MEDRDAGKPWTLVRIALAVSVHEEGLARDRNVMHFPGKTLDTALIEAQAWASAHNANRGEAPWILEWWDALASDWIYIDHVH